MRCCDERSRSDYCRDLSNCRTASSEVVSSLGRVYVRSFSEAWSIHSAVDWKCMCY